MIHANFTAELHCQHGQIVIADTSLSDHLFTSADEDGWLCTEAARNPANSRFKRGFKRTAFHFRYIEHTHDRTHYYISCPEHWDYAGARLERNSNGWLGLYGTHVVGRAIDSIHAAFIGTQGHVWKIETLQAWDGRLDSVEQIDCHLRDSYGQRVSQCEYGINNLTLSMEPFLNAGTLEGEILTFRLRNVKLG